MRLRFYTPSQGWRSFIDELIVVVLGVLIALGAQQLVDDWNWRGAVASYRHAVRDELSHDLDAYARRLEQTSCARNRLDQLARWQQSSASGKAGRLTHPISRPIGYSLRSSVWRSQTQDVASHLSLRERLAYAYLYDSFDNYETQRDAGRELWAEISEFEGAGPLTPEQSFRLRGLITRARALEDTININWPQIRERAASMGIRAERDPAEVEWLHALCEPLTWESA